MKTILKTHLVILIIFFSCTQKAKTDFVQTEELPQKTEFFINEIKNKETTYVDTLLHDNKYSDLNYLNKIISQTKYSTDTIFLGFRMGMTKAEFYEHFLKLKEDSYNIQFIKFEEIALTSTFSVEAENFIKFKKNFTLNIDKKRINGNGTYYLIPKYDKNLHVRHYEIVSNEKYDSKNNSYDKEWIKSEIFKISTICKDTNLKAFLYNKGCYAINYHSFFREKNNCILFTNVSSIEFVDKKTALIEIRNTLIENQKR